MTTSEASSNPIKKKVVVEYCPKSQLENILQMEPKTWKENPYEAFKNVFSPNGILLLKCLQNLNTFISLF